MIPFLRAIKSHTALWAWKTRCRLAAPLLNRTRPGVYSGGKQDWHGGPATKLNRLNSFFPNEPYGFNLIYSVSGHIPPPICRWAQGRGVKVVCHTNSMSHKAYAPDYVEINKPIVEVHALADHIVYGSRHAQEAARTYLGPSRAPSTILYNAVDTNLFRPVERSDGPPVILAAGAHAFRHRLEPLIRAMRYVLRKHPGAELVIAGPLQSGEGIFDCGENSIRKLIEEVGVVNTKLYGSYTEADAPRIFNQAHVLVHLKHMDWTPNVVIEAMSCGLPIVHAGNGGMPETVGEAGVSLDLPGDWDRIHTPEPEHLAAKIVEAYERRMELGKAARKRAVEMFDIRDWAEAHRRIFESLLVRE